MNFEEELADISSKIALEESQLRLQHLLTEKLGSNDLFSLKAQEILNNISTSLTKSVFQSKLYHMINRVKNHAEMELSSSIGRSLLDIYGNFLWVDSASEKFFKLSNGNYRGLNFFSLVSPSSLKLIQSRFSPELLSRSKRIVISYILINGIELSSRCTLVTYSPCPGCYKKGVFMQTRLSRHKLFNSSSLLISPLLEYSGTGLLFTPLQVSPSPFISNEAFIELESLRITPFLKGDSPYKKQKIDDYNISDF